MALTRFSGDADVISQLSNQPNDNDGLSAAQLKAMFDQFGSTFKTFFNQTFIPEVESAINAAAAGISSGGISGANINDRTVTAEKLSNRSGYEAVETAVVRDGAITKAKTSSEVQGILDAVAGKQAEHKTATITLESGETTWTKSVTGVTATNTVLAVAGEDDTSHEAWSNCDIRATSQSSGQLTFKARTAPASNVTVNILILD